MASKITMNLDTSKEIYSLLKCKQNDDLTLTANIFENGASKDLTNTSITIQALKADNTYIIQNTNITKSNNKITASLNRDFTRVSGSTKIEILLVEGGKQNTTFSFCLDVVGSVIKGAVTSTNTVTILEELESKIVEAGIVRDETEQLIATGGAATTGDIQAVNTHLGQVDTSLADASTKANDWNNFKQNGGNINGDVSNVGKYKVSSTKTTRGDFPMLNLDIVGNGGACMFPNGNKEIEFRKDGDQNGTLAKIIVGDIGLGTSLNEGNGYTTLPNGLILQWGTISIPNNTNSATFQFKKAFPNVCFAVVNSILDNGNNYSSSACRLINFSKNDFSIANSTSFSGLKATYFAIGY